MDIINSNVLYSSFSADICRHQLIFVSEMLKIDTSEDADNLNVSVCKAILEAAKTSGPKKGGKHKSKIVPWRTKECTEVIGSRNKLFRHNMSKKKSS